MTDLPGKLSKTDFKLDVAPNKKPLIYLLDGFQLAWGDRTIRAQDIRLRRGRDLLKLLALAPDHRLHRDQVLESLWPEKDPQKSARSLSQLLFTLRPILASLDPSFTIQYDDEALVLTARAGIWTDVEAFEQAAYNARIKPDPAECQAALLLYRGDLLPDDPYSDLFSRRREELKEAQSSLLNQLAAYHVNQGENPQAIELLRQLVEIDPANEEAQGMRMQAYAANGQRSLALKTYQEMAEVLEREYGTAPSEESQRAYHQLLEADGAQSVPSRSAVRHNLPVALTSFIGREDDLQRIGQSIQAHRLTTLTGAGGVGKTRLALKTTEWLPDAPYREIFWVELAPVENPARLIPALSAELGIRGSAGVDSTGLIQARLGDQPTLLILDNAEHLLAGAARLVEALLKGCPALTILVTSRAPLGISGESVFRVPSLNLPDPGTPIQVEQAEAFEGLRLFDERARLKYASFKLNAANIGAVSAICRRLDGIPLAIELAAALARVLTAEQIAARLDDVFALLVSREIDVIPRHQTLRAAIAWSYQLLSEKERLLLQRASVFSGCFSLEAAEEVCAGEGIEKQEVLDLLEALVDQSLISFDFEVHGVAFYRILETVRQYAREALLMTEDEAVLRDRHLAYFTALADRADTIRVNATIVAFSDQLYANLGNLRLALDWSLRGLVTLGLRLSTDLYWFWIRYGLGIEATDWWLKLLEVERTTQGDQPLAGERKIQRARALRSVSGMVLFYKSTISDEELKCMAEESITLLQDEDSSRGRHELGITYLYGLSTKGMSWIELEQKALDLFRAENDPFYVCQALILSGVAYWCAGEFAMSERLQNEALEMALGLDDYSCRAGAYVTVGCSEFINGNYPKAELCFYEDQKYELLDKDRQGLYNVQARWLMLCVAEGKFLEAESLGQNALRLAHDFQDRMAMAWTACGLARCAWAKGDHDLARRRSQEALSYTQDVVLESIFLMDSRYILGRIALSEQRFTQAARSFRDILERIADYMPLTVDLALDTVAILAAQAGQAERAALLFGKAGDNYQKMIHYFSPRESGEHDEGLALARANLGEARFSQADARGRAMTQPEAEACAKEILDVLIPN